MISEEKVKRYCATDITVYGKPKYKITLEEISEVEK